MFGKNLNSQKKTVRLSTDQIIEDIEVICLDDEQRNKIYFCLDNKPPNEQRFSKVDGLLKVTDNLDGVKDHLKSLVDEVQGLIEEIDMKIDDLKARTKQYQVVCR